LTVDSTDRARALALDSRRAQFVYDAARLAAEAAGAPIVPVPWVEREASFRDQFLKVIERQCGEQRSRSPEELHGSWMQAYFAMGWVYGEAYSREDRTHPDLVPYADLGQLERDKDAVFVALCEIARLYIRDMVEVAAQTRDLLRRWPAPPAALPGARPKIVCLCGSTRFYEAFQRANYEETMAGRIVLSVGFYPHATAEHGHGEGVGHDSTEKVMLDELHKRKIDLADEVLVLNIGGYIGHSTRSEIEYAAAHAKALRYLEPVAALDALAKEEVPRA
jgi:hypothetical protein